MQSLIHLLRPFLLLLLLTIVSSDLLWGDETTSPRTIIALPSFGEGDLSLTVLAKPPAGPDPGPPTLSPSDLYEVGAPAITSAADGFTNFTYPLALTGEVGVADLIVSAGSKTLKATLIAAGFVIKDSDGNTVSGDDRAGVAVGQDGETVYDVVAVGTNGKSVDLSDVTINPRPANKGAYMEEVDLTNTGFSRNKFTLAINKFRVGTGAFLIAFELPTVEADGETFETVLYASQSTTPAPPCVVVGSELVSRSGTVEVSMFNLLSPPLPSHVKNIVLSVGGNSYDYNKGQSSLVNPTSTVVFSSVADSGDASITCDGSAAVVLEDGVEVSDLTVTGESGDPLAKDTLIKKLPSPGSDVLITSTVRVVDSDPLTLTEAEAETIKAEYISTVSASKCVIANITAGSAIIFFGAVVSDADAAQKAVEEAFSSCAFQKNTGYRCSKLELGGSQTVNVAGSTAIAAGGIATWSIILIACIGAFSLIAVVSLSLWAVYRRSSDLSESSYNSAGPMGVPDPSDLLYEQTIVRDIYGRGEEGGPTAEEAKHSEVAATMREQYPHPPSSGTGISRARASSLGASSTYSV